MGQQSQSDVAIPASPTPDLIMVQPDFPLGALETLFNRPARPGHPYHLCKRRLLRGRDDIIGHLVGLSLRLRRNNSQRWRWSATAPSGSDAQS
jgi:hypothetical protein